MKSDKRKAQTSIESSKRKKAIKPGDKCVADKLNFIPDDYQEVIHDLRVHQTELAAQNEELRKMQHELEESHTQYVDLYDQAPVGYFTLDRKGNILAVNRIGSRQLGGGRDALLKRPFSSFMSQDDSDLFYLHLKKVFAASSKQTCSLTLLQENGTPFYAQLDSIPSSIGFGGEHSICRTTVTDISERRELEEALQASETRYRSLFEAAREGILILDAKTSEITDVNPFLTEILGYSAEEVLGKKLWDIGCLHDTAASKKVFSELQRKGYVRYDNLPLETKNGREIAVECISSIYLVNNTKVIQCNIRDVTDQNLLAVSSPVAGDETERRRAERRTQAHGLTEQYEQAIKENKQVKASLLQALAEIKALKDRLVIKNIYIHKVREKRSQFDYIIGQSDGLKYVLYRAEQVAPTDATVLILGETGTGKELIATAIHHLSSRRDRPLITVNCAALPANLLESELFGREKGAYTGADTRQVGRFESADGSTLCLDEIGELPLEMQAKLLRVIQHGQFERLGSSKTIKVDVRVVATTNRNLVDEIAGGRFRKDLYYRLNVFPITVPPLRKRVEDIVPMVHAFVQRYARKMGKQITSIPKETMQALQDYQWPGNVRELESIIERAVILCPGPGFQLADNLNPSPPLDSFLGGTVKEMERKLILGTLVEKGWQIEGKEGAAKILGLHPSTLRARMHKLGIVRGDVSSQSNSG
ncbi:sigma 54-interacting transcriptional regulator [Desulfocapsa sulfexigens]|nr:sigma 54-interacting transcriptional regulator [Desulfocapsa sulfexigens]